MNQRLRPSSSCSDGLTLGAVHTGCCRIQHQPPQRDTERGRQEVWHQMVSLGGIEEHQSWLHSQQTSPIPLMSSVEQGVERSEVTSTDLTH